MRTYLLTLNKKQRKMLTEALIFAGVNLPQGTDEIKFIEEFIQFLHTPKKETKG